MVAERKGEMIAVAAAVLSLLALIPFDAGAAQDGRPVDVRVKPVPMDAAHWNTDKVGKLRYRGGIHVSSSDRRFGGLSGLMVSADGTRFTAVSDRGAWTRGALLYDASGNLSGVSHVIIEPIRETDGQPLVGKRGDAESLSPAPGGGVLVSFERDPKLRIYRDGGGIPTVLAAPDGVEEAPPNNGMEAVTLLADGRLLLVTEHEEQSGRYMGWIGGADGWSRLTYMSGEGFKPTGAVTLANGDVVFVERRFPLLSARVRKAAAGALEPGAEIEAVELARFQGSLTFDNMEGIDAREGPNGETLIYLLSDDNFNGLQRTLLMMFEVTE